MAEEAETQLCSVCGSAMCTIYCTDAEAPTYLCDSCITPHRNNNPGLVHTDEVIDISQYQERCKRFAQGREELLRNLTMMDECCAQVSAVVDTLATPPELRSQLLVRMQMWKEQFSSDIHAALAEVEGSLDQNNVHFQSTYSQGLRNYIPGCLTFFSFQVNSDTVDAYLHSLTTECTQRDSTADKTLYWVNKSEIMTFNPVTLQTGPSIPLSTQIIKEPDSTFVPLGADKLVVCGGSNSRRCAYLLDTRSGTVDYLPDMLFCRDAPGIIVYRGDVHVFGSFSGDGGSQCERLRLSPAAWSALPSMHRKRSYFTPALWQSAVYLCGGHEQNNTVEVFNGLFMMLANITLPEGGRSLACVRENEVIVLTSSYFTVLSRLTSAASIQAASNKREGSTVRPFVNPVLLGNLIVQLFSEETAQYSVEDGNRLR